ncbi:MAG: helix-turn-helix domain-containing protein [Planctomycetales bacterium]|nr:helix-turn-helix domain-containing protein [Planctomycetales bacterium]
MTPREANRRIKNAFWTVDEAAKVFGLTPHSLRRKIRFGQVESTKLGIHRLIPAHAILQHFAEALDNPWTRYDAIRILNEHATMFGKDPFDFGILNQHNTPFPDDTPEDDDETADLKTAISGLVVEHSGNRIP